MGSCCPPQPKSGAGVAAAATNEATTVRLKKKKKRLFLSPSLVVSTPTLSRPLRLALPAPARSPTLAKHATERGIRNLETDQT